MLHYYDIIIIADIAALLVRYLVKIRCHYVGYILLILSLSYYTLMLMPWGYDAGYAVYYAVIIFHTLRFRYSRYCRHLNAALLLSLHYTVISLATYEYFFFCRHAAFIFAAITSLRLSLSLLRFHYVLPVLRQLRHFRFHQSGSRAEYRIILIRRHIIDYDYYCHFFDGYFYGRRWLGHTHWWVTTYGY